VGVINLGLLGLGIVLIAAGYLRAKAPYARYQALRDQDANTARYEAWRGGARDRSDRSTTGASVAMKLLRRQAQVGAVIAVVGFLLVFAGFAVK